MKQLHSTQIVEIESSALGGTVHWDRPLGPQVRRSQSQLGVANR